MKRFFNLYSVMTICSILGLIGIFMINTMNPLRTVKREGVAMDTVIGVVASAVKSSAELKKIVDDAFSLVVGLEKKFSMHDPDSEVSAVSAAAGRERVKVSSETFSVLAAALHIAGASEGVFDPTIGAVTLCWQDKLLENEIPSGEEIRNAVSKTGFDALKLSAPDGAYLEKGSLDLGGIAKGFISEAVRGLLRARGVTSALIDLGGNVVVMGGRPETRSGERSPWRIGIQHPARSRGTPICTVELFEGSVITAGDYERFWDVGGRRYTHIFDPASGRPIEGPLKSVTIVSNDPAQGDALSTAFMVMGEERAVELLRVFPRVEVIFVHEDEGKEYRVTATEGLRGSLMPSGGAEISFLAIQ
ncbi:MAG: FAD:protein FMN transferase [Synergistaceae bacterium]|nr:FAD:protein FMN transferase [Synergistaceae bacterium]